MAEEWRDVVDYKGLYSVSSHGRIYSHISKKLMKIVVHRNKRCFVAFSRNGKATNTSVHREVAKAFIGDLRHLHINHLNGNPTDNRVENLEWVTRSQNEIHSRHVLGNLCKPVIARHLVNGDVKRFPSVAKAAEILGLDCRHIARCARGEMRRHGPYNFKYEENNHE